MLAAQSLDATALGSAYASDTSPLPSGLPSAAGLATAIRVKLEDGLQLLNPVLNSNDYLPHSMHGGQQHAAAARTAVQLAAATDSVPPLLCSLHGAGSLALQLSQRVTGKTALALLLTACCSCLPRVLCVRLCLCLCCLQLLSSLSVMLLMRLVRASEGPVFSSLPALPPALQSIAQDDSRQCALFFLFLSQICLYLDSKELPASAAPHCSLTAASLQPHCSLTAASPLCCAAPLTPASAVSVCAAPSALSERCSRCPQARSLQCSGSGAREEEAASPQSDRVRPAPVCCPPALRAFRTRP